MPLFSTTVLANLPLNALGVPEGLVSLKGAKLTFAFLALQ
jgi:hypothetical protein